MDKAPGLEDLKKWRDESVKELEEAQRQLTSAQERLDTLRNRVGLIDRLLALEGAGPAFVQSAVQMSEDLLNACEHIMRDVGRPLHIRELHAILREKAVPIPGMGTEANLIVRLQRSNGRFIRVGRGKYALPEFGFPEVKLAKRRRRAARLRPNMDEQGPQGAT
jgi:hypothetical protein